jgi:hypothetical protein
MMLLGKKMEIREYIHRKIDKMSESKLLDLKSLIEKSEATVDDKINEEFHELSEPVLNNIWDNEADCYYDNL